MAQQKLHNAQCLLTREPFFNNEHYLQAGLRVGVVTGGLVAMELHRGLTPEGPHTTPLIHSPLLDLV